MEIKHNVEIKSIKPVPEYAIILRAHREKNKITQRQVAEKLGISHMGFSYFESGTRIPRLDKFEEWVEVLGLKTVITFVSPGKKPVTTK